jgi:hypothetical protein
MDDSGNDIVIINLRNGLYYRLLESSSRIFRQYVCIDQPNHEISLPESTLEREFLAILMSKNLIVGEIEEELELANHHGTDHLNISIADPSDLPEPIRFEEYGDLEDLLGLDPIHDINPEQGWPVVDD